jgi:putative ABC transport system permease protein
MSVITRGIKNSVRNPARTASVVGLLGVATAFALSLLLANQAVKSKIEDLKTSGATTLTIQSAGQAAGPGFQGGGEALTNDMYTNVKNLEHVTDSGALTGGGGIRVMSRAEAGQGNPTTTFSAPKSEINLESPIDAGTLGRRQFGGNTSTDSVPDFKLPVQAIGVGGNLDQNGKNYVLTAGNWFTTEDGYQAVIGKDLATHNNLSVGSTFTGYSQTFTVVGIYDAGDTFRNATVLVPLKTFQTLTSQPNELRSIIVKVDSIDNIDSVEAAINNKLGDDKIDITSSAQSTQDAISSLKSIQRISVAGVLIAVIAAAVIVFMVMVMIVRERKKEIAVLKAIGGSNFKITSQFVTEAVVLTLCSVVIGSLIALGSSNSITKLLINTNSKDTTSSSASSSGTTTTAGPGFGGATTRRIVGGRAAEQATTSKDLLKDVKTDVGFTFLAYGLGVVILIAILGSAIPAYAISKVRPAEVMRGE